MTENAISAVSPLPEGALIGLVGGGQLGMFFTQAAQRLGYRVCCFCNRPDEPAAKYADEVISASFTDSGAIEQFVEKCNVVTYEFESIPTETLASIDERCTLHPSFEVIQTTQDRALEKAFLKASDIPTSDFFVIETFEQLLQAVETLGASVLKTARDGYDGKGQWKLSGSENKAELEAVWEQVAGRKCTLEKLINLKKEVSVIVAGDQYGNVQTIGPVCNEHVNHILDTSWIDSESSEPTGVQAVELAKRIAERFGLIGTLCVEFFIDTDGVVLVNEIAPRPHNSGHLTIDSFSLSQFDLQAIGVSGQTNSEPVELESAVMVNLLGDLWLDGEPAFDSASEETDCDVHLHLYGKKEPRAGRKMGHATLVADSLEKAIGCAKQYRTLLKNAQPAKNHS